MIPEVFPQSFHRTFSKISPAVYESQKYSINLNIRIDILLYP